MGFNNRIWENRPKRCERRAEHHNRGVNFKLFCYYWIKANMLSIHPNDDGGKRRERTQAEDYFISRLFDLHDFFTAVGPDCRSEAGSHAI